MMNSDLMLTLVNDRHRDLIAEAAKHRLAPSRRRQKRWTMKRSTVV